MFSCDLCGEKYKHNRSLNRHIYAVHDKQDFDCNKCDFTSNRKDNLTRHVKSKHSKAAHEINIEPKHKRRRKDELNWGEEDLTLKISYLWVRLHKKKESIGVKRI